MSQQQQDSPNPARVLFADDDHAIRQLVCTIIQREGLAVDCVADGMEAIEKLQEREYAVILLDLMMPRVDGFGVVEYLKSHTPRKKPVVLVVTAYADQRFKEVDPTIVAGVIRKPFEVADIGSLVRLCVQGFDSIEKPSLAVSDQALRDLAVREWDQAREGRGDGVH